jgi:hypothetical protein
MAVVRISVQGNRGSHNRACVSLSCTSFVKLEHMSKNIARESYWTQCDLYFIYTVSFIQCMQDEAVNTADKVRISFLVDI